MLAVLYLFLVSFRLRWLEERVIPDDLAGYAARKALNVLPIAGGEYELTLYGSANCWMRKP